MPSYSDNTRQINCSGANPNLILDVLHEPAKLRSGLHVFVPGEAHFSEVVLVLGADGGARHEGPGRVVPVAAAAVYRAVLFKLFGVAAFIRAKELPK